MSCSFVLPLTAIIGVIAVVGYNRILDRRQDIFRRPTLRTLELRDRIFQLGPADAAIELVRFDAMPALTAVTPLCAERAFDVFIETPRRQVVAAGRLVLSHDRLLSVRTS